VISTYTDLTTAVTEYLARDQDTTLIARIPTFVQLAEAKFNRMLFCRQMEQRAVTVLDPTQTEPEYIALPVGFQSMRRIRLTSVSGKPRLQYKSGSEMDEYRYQNGDVAGQPWYFTVFGNEIEVCPTPDNVYTVEMVYRQNVPALASNSTNWLLALCPDAYLYGTLLESAPYIKEDERIQTWMLGMQTSIEALNELEKTSNFNAGPLVTRVSGVTP
jgi:hypothetical protein